MQARARKLQQELPSTKIRQKHQADQALAEGDQLFQQGEYHGAWEKYEETVLLFVALQRQEREPEKASSGSSLKTVFVPSPWSHWLLKSIAIILQQKTRLVLVGGLVLVVGIGMYLVSLSGTLRPSPGGEITKPPEIPVLLRNPDPPPATPQPSPPIVQSSPDVNEQPSPIPPVPGVSEEKPPPVPDSSVPLQIAQATPDGASELTVTEGQGLKFAVEAKGGTGETLQYLWLLDGREKAKGKKWTYQPDFTEGGETPKQVTAIVTAGANQKVEKTWQVRVLNKDRPPRITAVSPYIDPIEVSPGEAADFSVTAADPDQDDRLVYIWALNGQEVAHSNGRRQFRAPPSSSPYKVTVTVVDQDGQTDQMDWRVNVKASSRGPHIVLFQPRENKVSTRVGQPLDFSVTAELPRGGQKQLRYQWSVEDGSSTTTATGNRRFIFDAPGIYHPTVFSIDSEGLQSPAKRWVIEVQP